MAARIDLSINGWDIPWARPVLPSAPAKKSQKEEQIKAMSREDGYAGRDVDGWLRLHEIRVSNAG